jgi:hypothetical protein
MAAGAEFSEVLRLAWQAILSAKEAAVRCPPGGVPQDTIVCVVWCAHGKHRSVCLAEGLAERARSHAGYAEVEVVHCERPRWDFTYRARWGESERCFALPLEWVLTDMLRVDLNQLEHQICFMHLQGATEDPNRIRTAWHAARDKRIPPSFFHRRMAELQMQQVRIPARRSLLK